MVPAGGINDPLFTCSTGQVDKFEILPAKHMGHILCKILNPWPAEPEEANWSGSALFAIKYVNLYQQAVSSNLIGWKLEMGVAS